MLEQMQLSEAAARIHKALDVVLAARTVTADLAGQMDGAAEVGCKEFGELLGAAL